MPTEVVPMPGKHYRHYNMDMLESQLKDSECGLRVCSHEYIYRTPWWLPFFLRLTRNRLYTMEVKWVMNIAWRVIWRKYRYANESNGRHLVAYLNKTAT